MASSCSFVSKLLAVNQHGIIGREQLKAYAATRTEEVAKRLQDALVSGPASEWYDDLSEKDLYDHEGKYLGEASGEAQTLAAVQRAKATYDPKELVTAVEDVILNFCGFQSTKTIYIANALHFQFGMAAGDLLATSLTSLAEVEAPSDADKSFFDETMVASAELLLRTIVETDDGDLLANPFSPGAAMGKLHKLPLFAQLIMVLINAVEATWYQQELPDCPVAINLYASLLVDDAPIKQMVEGVQQVEIMEMTKGAERGRAVVEGVRKIRDDFGIFVLLDDFDSLHPGMDSEPDAIKVSVMATAGHALQVFKNDGAPVEMPVMDKEKTNDKDFMDYFCALLPKTKPNITMVIVEGSENVLKSEVSPGPPLDFGQQKSVLASLHLCQAIAKALHNMNPAIQIRRQGGRALYADEEFDPETSAVVAKTKKPLPAARNECGTMAYMGREGARRAALKVRSRVCGVRKADGA